MYLSIFMHRLNNSFPCFMNFKTRGAAEFKDHKTWKSSVLPIKNIITYPRKIKETIISNNQSNNELSVSVQRKMYSLKKSKQIK